MNTLDGRLSLPVDCFGVLPPLSPSSQPGGMKVVVLEVLLESNSRISDGNVDAGTEKRAYVRILNSSHILYGCRLMSPDVIEFKTFYQYPYFARTRSVCRLVYHRDSSTRSTADRIPSARYRHFLRFV